jgi:chemotaxis protein MotB
VLLATPACVTRGTHREVVAERDQLLEENQALADRVKLLGASTESLSAERVRLMDEMEDLRATRDGLESNVQKLERTEEILSSTLRDREAKLASTQKEIQDLRGTYEGLVEDLEQELADGHIQIEQLREGIRLNLTQDVLFPSGSAQLNDSGVAVLRKVASRVESVPHRVEVQGHTDDVPVSGRLAKRFPSNWELAGARAGGVVRVLAGAGIPETRLTAVSFGEFMPVASNETDEGRALNRRIEIRLIPATAAPVPASAGP